MNKQNSFPVINEFLKHIFEDEYEKALDYIQILHARPAQKLPALVLFSEKPGVGKSLFLGLVKLILGYKMLKTEENPFSSNYNSHWVYKHVIAIDEAYLGPVLIERVKTIVTADYLTRYAKFQDTISVESMVKIIIATNSRDNIEELKQSRRFWVVELDSKRIIDFDKKPFTNFEMAKAMSEEVPHFISYLENDRQLKPTQGRFYFRDQII